jgi:ribose 5-phosphate isomerase B
LQLARRLAREWLGYEFDPASHSQANVDEIVHYEKTGQAPGSGGDC